MSQLETVGTSSERQRKMIGDDFWVLIGSGVSEVAIYKDNGYANDFEPSGISLPNVTLSKKRGFETWVHGAPLIARNIARLIIENERRTVYDRGVLVSLCSDFRSDRALKHRQYGSRRMEVIKLRGRVIVTLSDLLSCQILHAIGFSIN